MQHGDRVELLDEDYNSRNGGVIEGVLLSCDKKGEKWAVRVMFMSQNCVWTLNKKQFKIINDEEVIEDTPMGLEDDNPVQGVDYD